VLTGGYWDQFLLAPLLHGRPFRNLAMIGYAGGTVGRAYGAFWPQVQIQGIELDPQVTAVGRRYFGLASNPRVSVATADGRVYLETHDAPYDAIFLDAFQQPYIPFYLTTQEFWGLASDRLKARGMVMANIGRIPADDSLARNIAGTMATRFASVFLWQQSGYNDMVIGFRHRVSRATLAYRLLRAPYPLAQAASLARRLHPIGPSSSPLTDDKAPIEWMTDNMIIQYVSAH
jgi:spermidine synthase